MSEIRTNLSAAIQCIASNLTISQDKIVFEVQELQD
ncbi:hypothetical protein Misp06_01024 [Microbulbifer sp. NBRC 101763]